MCAVHVCIKASDVCANFVCHTFAANQHIHEVHIALLHHMVVLLISFKSLRKPAGELLYMWVLQENGRLYRRCRGGHSIEELQP